MLTLTRRVGQRILIGDGVQIEVRDVRGSQVRLGIVAPAGMPVMREELYAMMAAENARAAQAPSVERLEQIASSVGKKSRRVVG